MRLLGFVIQSILAGGGYLASFLCSREYRNHIVEEQRWWQSHLMCGSELTGIVLFSQLVAHYPEYVNLYLYRLRRYSTIHMGRIWSSSGQPDYPERIIERHWAMSFGMICSIRS